MLLKLDIRLTRTPPGSESSRALWLGYILIYLESHTWASKNRRWGRLARCDATKHPTVARRSKQIHLWSTITSTNTTTYGRMPPHNVVQQLRSEFSVTKKCPATSAAPPCLALRLCLLEKILKWGFQRRLQSFTGSTLSGFPPTHDIIYIFFWVHKTWISVKLGSHCGWDWSTNTPFCAFHSFGAAVAKVKYFAENKFWENQFCSPFQSPVG